MKTGRTALIALLAAVCLPGQAQAKPCPALLGVAKDGRYFMDRGGAWVRQSPGVIETMLAGGCYPEDGPSPTSSVTLAIAAGAPKARVDALYALIAHAGWPREKVVVEAWKNAPQRP